MHRNKPVVVCDASALINLALINQLYLLEAMFGSVCIPPEVYDEVVRRGSGKVGAEGVQTSSFIEVVQLRHPNQVALYTGPLSHADAEVLVLAQEQHADLVITRDRRMRRRARQEGLTVITTFALLIEAKRGGFVQAVKPLLDEMRSKGILIRDGTYQETLRQARELPRE
jgi:predicted nucleic acid-binding protein